MSNQFPAFKPILLVSPQVLGPPCFSSFSVSLSSYSGISLWMPHHRLLLPLSCGLESTEVGQMKCGGRGSCSLMNVASCAFPWFGKIKWECERGQNVAGALPTRCKRDHGTVCPSMCVCMWPEGQ